MENQQPVQPVMSAPTQPPISQPEPSSPRHSDGLKNVLTTLAVLIAAPLIALFITSFLFQSYEVFGPSMQSTLHNGDRLIVLKAPRSWSKLRGKTFMPMRGQIIIFTKLDLFVDGGDGSNKQLIKRVMGLPGDRVVVKDGVLTIYNTQHPDGYQPDKTGYWSGNIPESTPINGEWTVGDGEVFACGDNRVNSLDSRTFGPIKTKDIVGTASFRFLPVSQSRSF
jgi:signal peptidase I